MVLLSNADEPCGPEDGVCKIVSCMEKLYSSDRGLCEVHYYRRERVEEVIEEYPDPLNWLLSKMVERNCEEWIGEKPRTHGADQVRETGLTTNQQRWAKEIAEQISGDSSSTSTEGDSQSDE